MSMTLDNSIKITRVKEDLKLNKRYKIDTILAENIIRFLSAKAKRLRKNTIKLDFIVSKTREVTDTHKAVLTYVTCDNVKKKVVIDRVGKDFLKESIFEKEIEEPIAIKYHKLER